VDVLSPYVHRYLRLMAFRLLDGHNDPGDRAVGLVGSAFGEIKYTDINQVKADLDKLLGSYGLSSRVEELNVHHPDTIQASTVATTALLPARVVLEERLQRFPQRVKVRAWYRVLRSTTSLI